MKNFEEAIQSKINGQLFKCNEAHADMFIKKHEKEKYTKQYEALKQLQVIVTETKILIDKINNNIL
jgi:hypothetical protein